MGSWQLGKYTCICYNVFRGSTIRTKKPVYLNIEKYCTMFPNTLPYKENADGDNSSQRKTFRISIEGNIASGKSTLLERFSNYSFVECHAEPIKKWRNLNGTNLLDLLYSDLKRWNFLFRSYAQLTFYELQSAIPSNPTTTVQLFERSIQNNRYCFVEQAYTNGYLTDAEYQVIIDTYDLLITQKDVNLDLIVYIRTTPEIVFERMKKRGRSEEITVPIEYLQQLHDMHEKWLNVSPNNHLGYDVLILDGNKDLTNIESEYAKMDSYLLNCFKMLN